MRNESQENGDGDCFKRIKSLKLDDLIGGVQDQGDKDNLARRLDPLSQSHPAFVRIRQDRPEIGRSPFTRILDAVAHREKRRHPRLKEESERQRPPQPPQEIFPKTLQYVLDSHY